MILAIALFCGMADRMRGGWPTEWSGPKWTRNLLRMGCWYSGGALIALYLQPGWWCLLAGVLMAQGDRQDMSVMAELIRTDGNRPKGWLGQLRIGAVFAACVLPILFADLHYWPMVPACLLAPAAGMWVSMQGAGPMNPWAWAECWRGFLMAALAAGFNCLNL